MNTINILNFEQACQALQAGKIIAYPTETFYGLGCNALDADAVGAIFSLKKRDLTMPLPVIISDIKELSRIVSYIPDTAQKLMDIFWPGSLSIVFPAQPHVPDLLTAGKGRLAVRFSPHPVPTMLGKTTGLVLVSSSANLSGQASATKISELPPALLSGIAGIYDAPPAPKGGLPSTVVDIVPRANGELVRICRAGVISAEDLQKAGFEVENCSSNPVCHE